MTALVLLPGMDGTGALFEPLLAALDPRLHTIVVRYPESVSLDYAALIALARDKLPTEEEFFILGESFSGPVAVSLAAQAPRNLRGLILCASFVRSPVRWPSLHRHLTGLLPFGRIPAAAWSIPLLGWFADSEARRLLAGAISMVHPDNLRARIRAVLSVDVRENTLAVKVPFLYLQASSDWIVPKSASVEIRELAPALQVVELLGPHMLLQISPGPAARSIEAFVNMALLQTPLE